MYTRLGKTRNLESLRSSFGELAGVGKKHCSKLFASIVKCHMAANN